PVDLILGQRDERQQVRRDHRRRIPPAVGAVADHFEQFALVRAKRVDERRIERLFVAEDRDLIAGPAEPNVLRRQFPQQLFDHQRTTFRDFMSLLVREGMRFAGTATAACLPTVAASSAIVGVAKRARTSAFSPSWRMRSMSVTVRSECPPRTKKLS